MRQFYNGNARDDRNKCESFTGNLVAGMFNFQPHEFFSATLSVAAGPGLDSGGAGNDLEKKLVQAPWRA